MKSHHIIGSCLKVEDGCWNNFPGNDAIRQRLNVFNIEFVDLPDNGWTNDNETVVFEKSFKSYDTKQFCINTLVLLNAQCRLLNPDEFLSMVTHNEVLDVTSVYFRLWWD